MGIISFASLSSIRRRRAWSSSAVERLKWGIVERVVARKPARQLRPVWAGRIPRTGLVRLTRRSFPALHREAHSVVMNVTQGG